MPLAQQNLEVFDPTSGADLGSIEGNETLTSLFGLTNAEFTVASDSAAAGGSDSALPTVGSVYDVFNLGNGYENVYTAIPSTTGGPDTVTDVLVTPNGDVNLDSLFGNIDAAALMQPGDAFTGLEVGNISGAADAFSIGGFTLDPQLAAGGEGFDGVTPLASSPPLLEIGGSSLGNPDIPGNDFATQSFDVFSGTGSSATDVGTHHHRRGRHGSVGLHQHSTHRHRCHRRAATAAASDLPTVGSVYDAFNLGNGYENVYTAIPGIDGAKDTVTDTLVTPFGNVNLDSLFGNIDAAAPMQPGDAFTGLEAGDSSSAPTPSPSAAPPSTPPLRPAEPRASTPVYSTHRCTTAVGDRRRHAQPRRLRARDLRAGLQRLRRHRSECHRGRKHCRK